MIERSEIFAFARKAFDVEPDYPFEKFPHYAVLRHGGDDKWFALIMDVDRQRLGLDGEDKVDVIDIKCPPEKIDQLRRSEGFLPAYHMNKEHWITVLLDGSVSLGEVKRLLGESFDLTR
ncbi:hypothetical protein D3C81_750220 [compost metagenome]